MVPTVYTDVKGHKIVTNQVSRALLYFLMLFIQHAKFVIFANLKRYRFFPELLFLLNNTCNVIKFGSIIDFSQYDQSNWSFIFGRLGFNNKRCLLCRKWEMQGSIQSSQPQLKCTSSSDSVQELKPVLRRSVLSLMSTLVVAAATSSSVGAKPMMPMMVEPDLPRWSLHLCCVNPIDHFRV